VKNKEIAYEVWVRSEKESRAQFFLKFGFMLATALVEYSRCLDNVGHNSGKTYREDSREKVPRLHVHSATTVSRLDHSSTTSCFP
jgi:hypothetical protein